MLLSFRTTIAAIAAAVALLIAVSQAAVDEPSAVGTPIVGTQIYAKSETVTIRVNTTNIGTGADLTYPCRVRDVNGEWLWVWVGGKKVEGWIKRADVCTAKEAVAFFSDKLQADAKDSFALLQRARAWEELGELNKAIDDDSQLIALRPKAFAYNERGLKRTAKRDFDQAIADFDEALALEPKFALARNNRGNAQRAKGSLDAALIDYDAAIHLDDKNPLFYSNCGNAWLEKGNADQALANYEQAIPLDPKNAPLRLNRGNAWLEKGEVAKGADDFQQAIELDPKNAEARNNLAWLRATTTDDKLRDAAAAVQHATKACELTEWKNFTFLDTLAAAYAESGDFEKAAGYAKKAADGATASDKADCLAHWEQFKAQKPIREAPKSK